MGRIAIVIVTRNRPAELSHLLTAIGEQHRQPNSVIVVENGNDTATGDVVRAHSHILHLSNVGNLGGAGGFAYGILAALAQDASLIWVMDDDGLPEDQNCLLNLAAVAEKTSAHIVSPIVIDIKDSSILAFPYYVGLKRFRSKVDIQKLPRIVGFAHLFNGALISAEAFRRFGIPDYRLFIRGDEVDFMNRVRRGGGHILTLPHIGFRHPSGAPETVPLLGGYLNAVVPHGDLKRFYFFRNRGYLVREHRLVLQFCSDLIRYPAYFLFKQRGDWRGFVRWVHLTLRGFRKDFTPFDPITDTDVWAAPRGEGSSMIGKHKAD